MATHVLDLECSWQQICWSISLMGVDLNPTLKFDQFEILTETAKNDTKTQTIIKNTRSLTHLSQLAY